MDSKEMPDAATPAARALSILGLLMIAAGLLGIVFGASWSKTAFELLGGYKLSLLMELAVPFLPIIVITAGAALITKFRH